MIRLSLYKTLFIVLFATQSVYAVPSIISHRGGCENAPENTIYAFSKSIEMGCDALELDVQVTSDGVVVLYHPEDLSKWTEGNGSVSLHRWEEIAALNAAYKYKPECGYPHRTHNLHIPRLEEVLDLFPKTLIIVDMKSLPAESLVKALIEAISDEESHRLIFYSTNAEHIDLLNAYKPHWRTFEKRDLTRQRLLEFNQGIQPSVPTGPIWMGFELKRKMKVTETFALGEGSSSIEFHLWNPSLVSCLRRTNPELFLVLFGINTEEDWEEANLLGVDAVYTDHPSKVLGMKNKAEQIN